MTIEAEWKSFLEGLLNLSRGLKNKLRVGEEKTDRNAFQIEGMTKE